MAIGRRTYLRWLALAGMALAAEFSIAVVAIAVAGRSPSAIVGRSTTASPSPLSSQAPNASPRIPNSPSPVSTSNQSARPWAAAAFYPPSGKVVFFGGVTAFSASIGPQASSETWTWDGASWLQLHPVNSPPARYYAGLAYDPLHQVLVLYGGTANGQGTWLNDTWTWDGTNWKQMSPAESPPKWFTAPMTYDVTRKVVLLYVGVGEWPITPPNQTWAWDGSTWNQIPTPADPNTGTGGSPDGTLAYDSTTAQTLYVGASGTWVLEAGGWRRISGGGTSNGSDYHSGSKFAVTDDPARGVLVEVGVSGDTWTWDGNAWTAQNPSVAPPPRSGEALAYDASHQQVVLFGGSVSSPGSGLSGLSDTWVWDGKTWKQVA
jgi:hypothetical protein